MSGTMLRVGALWRSKDGKRAKATGNISLPAGAGLTLSDNQRLVMVANDAPERVAGKHPDWFLLVADAEDNTPSTVTDDGAL